MECTCSIIDKEAFSKSSAASIYIKSTWLRILEEEITLLKQKFLIYYSPFILQ